VSGIEVDVAGLRAGAALIRTAGATLTGEVEQLRGTVEGAGSPWGADEAGTLFGMAYTEVLTHALDVYASMAEQLTEVADKLAGNADRYDLVESDSRGLFDRLEPPGVPARFGGGGRPGGPPVTA
jgi:hypothetical protein